MSNIRTYRVNHAMQMISVPLHSTTSDYHLGNNREVVEASGTVTQVTNDYPFGAPYADASATLNPSLQAYKYNGKELDLMHGLNTYDYGARQHDPILARWDRIDPLCEKYYSTSPYAYCANNPVKFIDPDGRKIDTSQMSDEELNSYNQFINGICSYEMMQTVYEALQNSDATFQVSFDKRTGSTGDFVDGQFVVGADDKGGNIYLDRDKGMNGTLSGLAIMEEFFHAYQNDNSANYTGEFNREFEAKTFCIAATGQTADLYQGMQAWSEGIALGKYSGQFEYISPAASSPKFLEEYQSSANQYASFNKQHNIGNINYHQATTCKPQNLINVINLTYKK